MQAGDSLRAIAQRVYGNDHYWYVIAEANGLDSDDDLSLGMPLRIPALTVNRNDGTTFKPYNPAELIGDTTPNLPYLPAPPGPKCSKTVQIIVVIVMIIITICSMGAASGAVGAAVQAGTMTYGAAAGAMVGAAIATNMVTQMAYDAVGLQDGISATQMGVAGATAGLTYWASGAYEAAQAMGEAKRALDTATALHQALATQQTLQQLQAAQQAVKALQTVSQFAQLTQAAGNAAAAYLINYGVQKVQGRDVSFRWRDLLGNVAAAAAEAALSTGQAHADYDTGAGSYRPGSASNGSGSGWGALGLDVLKGFGRNAVGYGVRKGFGASNTHWDGEMELADAFGNSIGNALVAASSAKSSANRPNPNAATTSSSGTQHDVGMAPIPSLLNDAGNDDPIAIIGPDGRAGYRWPSGTETYVLPELTQSIELDPISGRPLSEMPRDPYGWSFAPSVIADGMKRMQSKTPEAQIRRMMANTYVPQTSSLDLLGGAIRGALQTPLQAIDVLDAGYGWAFGGTDYQTWNLSDTAQISAAGSGSGAWNDYETWRAANSSHPLGMVVFGGIDMVDHASSGDYLGATLDGMNVLGGATGVYAGLSVRTPGWTLPRSTNSVDSPYSGWNGSAIADFEFLPIQRTVLTANSTPDFVWHATTNPGAAQGVLTGINPRYLNPDSRFGAAFYIAEQPGTTIAELAHHGAVATHGIRFNVNADAMRVLDLTSAENAGLWGYNGGPISSSTQSIGVLAQERGFNAIRFFSERSTGSVNIAVLDDFNEILRPVIVTPVKP